MDKNKQSIQPTEPITLDKLLEAKTLSISGASIKEIAETLNLNKRDISKRLNKLDSFLTEPSNVPIIQEDKKELKNLLKAKLDAIKEGMTNKSMDIINKADDIVIDRLSIGDPDSKTKELADISKQYSERLSKLTGLEELSTDDDNDKKTNIYIQNIFNRFENKTNEPQEQPVDNSQINTQ